MSTIGGDMLIRDRALRSGGFSTGAATAPPARGGRAAPAPYDGFFRYLPTHHGGGGRVRLTGVGWTRVRPGAAYPPPNHPKLYAFDWRRGRVLPEFQVLLLTDAVGEFESEPTGHVPIRGEQLVFLFPGVWHRYRPAARHGWTERWLSVDGQAVRGLLNAGLVEPSRAVTRVRDAAQLVRGFDRLIDGVRQDPVRRPESSALMAMRLVQEAVQQALANVCDEGGEQSDAMENVHDEIVHRALEIIWNHRHNPPLGVNEVARQLPVTRRTLDRRFAEVLGRSVLEEINACRLSRAKRLLSETDLPIKTVSYLAGFPSRERMRLLFLSEEGATPTEFRDRVRQERADV